MDQCITSVSFNSCWSSRRVKSQLKFRFVSFAFASIRSHLVTDLHPFDTASESDYDGSMNIPPLSNEIRSGTVASTKVFINWKRNREERMRRGRSIVTIVFVLCVCVSRKRSWLTSIKREEKKAICISIAWLKHSIYTHTQCSMTACRSIPAHIHVGKQPVALHITST